jgi:hypothetical protein
VNPRRHSTPGTGFSLSMPLSARMSMPYCGPLHNRQQQFVMSRFVDEGSHESLGGDEDSGVHLPCRRVLPPTPTGFGGRLPQGNFVDGTEEDEDELFCGMFAWLLSDVI